MGWYTNSGWMNVTTNDGLPLYGIYHPNGSIRVTTVPGTVFVGLYAPNGSYNVVVTDGTTGTYGRYHGSGALKGTSLNISNTGFSPNGSINMVGLSVATGPQALKFNLASNSMYIGQLT